MAELVREVRVSASPSTLFALLTEPTLAEQWFGTEIDLDPRSGGIFKALLGGDHPALGSFIEVVPDEKVVFTFGWDEPDHPIPPGSTEVAITLIPDGDDTVVRLVHSGLPDDAIADHSEGWNFYLVRLSSVAAGGEVEPDAGPAPTL